MFAHPPLHVRVAGVALARCDVGYHFLRGLACTGTSPSPFGVATLLSPDILAASQSIITIMAHQMPAAAAAGAAAGSPAKGAASSGDVVIALAAAPELERAPPAKVAAAPAAHGHGKASSGSRWAIPFILGAAASIVAIAVGVSIWCVQRRLARSCCTYTRADPSYGTIHLSSTSKAATH